MDTSQIERCIRTLAIHGARRPHRLSPRVLSFTTTIAVLLCNCCNSDDAARLLDENTFFESKIRPLLVEHCYECHGTTKQESGLRLDSREDIVTGGDSGPAARADQSGESLILRAVRQDGPLSMPPDGKLRPDQIKDLTRWIRLGLAWPETDSTLPDTEPADPKLHWAFQPAYRASPVAVEDQSWPVTSIDCFILARLEALELTPAPRARSHTLIRRATLDLLGLPPTPEEVSHFERAWLRNPNAAWCQLIDRLLNSAHYGERQGRLWLDVARYADNKGYVFFEEKNFPWAWTYRDWVVRAFNEDLPYDQFILHQLAADQLPGIEDPRSLAAMGFLTLGPRFMNNTHDVIDDRIDVVTRGLMGLTVTCARCHDHKFDPIPQEDYYSLYGVFRSSIEPTLRPLCGPVPDTKEYRAFKSGLRERSERLEAFIETQRKAMIQGARTRVAEYLLAVHRKRNHPATENFMLLTDKGAIIPAMVHRWELYLKNARRENDPVWTLWHKFSDLPDAEFASRADQVYAQAFTEEAQSEINQLVKEAFADGPPKSMQDVANIYGGLFKKIDTDWQKLLRDDINKTSFADEAAEAIRQVLYGKSSPPMVPRELGWGFLDLLPDRPTQGEFKKLLGELEKFSVSEPGAPPRAMVLLDSDVLFQPVVFQRGNPNRQGDAVPRRFLRVLSPPKRPSFESGSGRLELARAIADPTNPLTARVMVNRIWQPAFWHRPSRDAQRFWSPQFATIASNAFGLACL